MSVLMILRVQADADALVRATEENRDEFLQITERVKGRGAVHHAFYAGDGEVMVVDEWETAEAFQSFFEDEASNIGPLMAAAGAQPSEPSFYMKLDVGDASRTRTARRSRRRANTRRRRRG